MSFHRLHRLKDRHAGERVVLVANGPSLNRMNLDFLRGQTVIGLNKIFLGFKKFGFYPKYYVAVNDLVIQQAAEQIRGLSCTKFLSKRNAQWVPENALTYYLETRDPPARFCHDIVDGVHEGWTVTYVALQIARYLGFHEVIIIGMDHHYEYSGVPNETKVLQGDDPNHFSPDYFGGGQKWDNPDLAHAEESYRIARQEFEREDRRIIDATVSGACTVFEKEDYRKLFGLIV